LVGYEGWQINKLKTTTRVVEMSESRVVASSKGWL